MTGKVLLYVTCAIGGDEASLRAFHFEPETGALSELSQASGLSDGLTGPIFSACDNRGLFLYVADPVPDVDGSPGGAVASFKIDRETGGLTRLNRKACGGEVPCYLSVSKNGKFILVANYGSGSVSVLPIGEDGSLGDVVCSMKHDVPPGGKGANAHSIILDPSNRHALVADLGVGRILVYRFDDETGQLTPGRPPWVSTAKGAGPRHVKFHPNEQLLLCMTEYDNTMISLNYDAKGGALTLIEAQSSLPPGYTETTYGSDVQLHPNGRFVYGSNRGHNSIAIFEIDAKTGSLKLLGHEPTGGDHPRGTCIDPTGNFLLVANQNSDNILTFKIDAESGRLAPVGDEVQVLKPVWFTFIPR
jgi:6-phosphogluconolactonase